MKTLRKPIYSLLLAGSVLSSQSCRKGFEALNTPYNEASTSTVTVSGLFNGLTKVMVSEDNTLAASLFYPMTNQQAVQNTFAPYINYTSSLWNNYYPALNNYKALLKLIEQQSDPAAYNNIKYMASVMMGARTLHMLDYYGDIPYSKAALAANGPADYRPTYDKQADVYKSVLADLKAAANGIKSDPAQVNLGASESFLGNDFTAWVKFANSLRLRYAVRLYGKEQALATEIISDILGGNKPLPDNQDLTSFATMKKSNFGVWISTLAPAQSNDFVDKFWYAFREASVSNIRLSTNVWNQISNDNNPSGSGIFDPRTYVYFMTNNADEWVPQPQTGASEGGTPYKNTGAAVQSRPAIGSDPNNKFSSFNFFMVFDYKNFPYLIISEADVHFLKAEIYQKGMGIAKDIVKAKNEYEAGIKSSIDFWYKYAELSPTWLTKPTAPTALQITTMLTNPKVLYNGSNDADALKKIATQSWLANMFQPEEAWATVRRTGLTPKDPAYNPIVANKLPYPDKEKELNNSNWQAATAGASPTEQMQTKVYWMQ